MSCVNLPTVLPGSPSKTRGQIQVRARGPGPCMRDPGRGRGSCPSVREQRAPK